MFRLHLTFALLVASLAVAQRVDDFDLASLTITRVLLTPLPDGGCSAEWCGGLTSIDGGASVTDCVARELKSTANQNRCDALGAAGVGALSKQLRLVADAGTSP